MSVCCACCLATQKHALSNPVPAEIEKDVEEDAVDLEEMNVTAAAASKAHLLGRKVDEIMEWRYAVAV